MIEPDNTAPPSGGQIQHMADSGARLSRRALMAGAGVVALAAAGAPSAAADPFSDALAAFDTEAHAVACIEPDTILLRACLDWLDGVAEVDRLNVELQAMWVRLGDVADREHPEIVAAWRRVDEACDRAGDHLNRLCAAEATSIFGVFAKVVAVARFDLDDEEAERNAATDVLPDLVRLVKPSAGPLVRRILAHPAIAEVLAYGLEHSNAAAA